MMRLLSAAPLGSGGGEKWAQVGGVGNAVGGCWFLDLELELELEFVGFKLAE